MQTQHNLIDRKGWPAGPWDDEPDRAIWRAHGHVCLVKRNRMGAWCGYVGVPPGHPWHGRDMDMTYSDGDPEVHGGVTYSQACDDNPHTGICHVPEPGEPDHLWWVGFDCAHALDRKPGMEASLRAFGVDAIQTARHEAYRTIRYVRHEVERLAKQAAETKA